MSTATEIFLCEDTAPTCTCAASLARRWTRGWINPSPSNIRVQVPTAAWNHTPGFYTHYGDVCELIIDVDDKTFDGRSLRPLPAG